MPKLPALKTPADLASTEADASTLLSKSLEGLLQAANGDVATPKLAKPSKPITAKSAVPAVTAISGPGITASGSHPNILSQQARYRLNRSAQLSGLLALSLVPITATILAREGVGWSAVPVALTVAALGLFLIAYFTVMGFGDVNMALQFGPGGNASGTSGNESEPDSQTSSSSQAKAKD